MKCSTIAKFEIKAPVGHKRREIIRAVVLDKADDKSEQNIESIVKQVDHIIKTQLNIIPPEPYYIIQMAENFMNHVGERISFSVGCMRSARSCICSYCPPHLIGLIISRTSCAPTLKPLRNSLRLERLCSSISAV